MNVSWLRFFIYAATAFLVTALWTIRAKTENQDNNFASITAIADGSARLPFVKRRLLADSANGIAWAVPATVWDGLSTLLDHSRMVRGDLGWKRPHDPVLLSATLLIGLSVVGFMRTMRALLLLLYEMPSAFADVAALAFGFCLLGGGGDVRFGFYPYDLPQTFLLALSLWALLAQSRWLWLVFALASYSKETSALLIPACVLLHWGRPARGWVPIAVTLGVIFLAVRGFLAHEYGPGAGGFWFPGRNARWIAWSLIYDAPWYVPFWTVSAVRIGRMWPRFPLASRRLLVLIVVLPVLAFFKGWIEEKRQYLEMLPILGPLLLQWLVTELGFGSWMRARRVGVDESVY